jgi:hypothetical protein
MKIVIVGRLNERRHVRWVAALLLSCALGIFGAAVASAVYFVLCGAFSPIAAIIGFWGPFITVGVGIQNALRTPVERLSPLS